MKKLIKFKTIEVVKEIEKEIELPAYFILGKGKPSDGGYFNIVKVTDPESDAEAIQSPFDFTDRFFKYAKSVWTPNEIVSDDRFIQVDESEWDLAVDMLIKEVTK